MEHFRQEGIDMDCDIYIPAGESRCEITVKNSRFIGHASSVTTPEEARRRISEERLENPGCTHVVFAFIVGGRNSEVAGMSDDGEPKGTAGRPVMEVLKGKRVRRVLVTVTRFFGGTKLGTGGLVKAYSECARKVLEALPVEKLVERVGFTMQLPYNLHDKVKAAVLGAGGRIDTEDFGDSVLLEGDIPEEAYGGCRKDIEDITRGTVLFRKR